MLCVVLWVLIYPPSLPLFVIVVYVCLMCLAVLFLRNPPSVFSFQLKVCLGGSPPQVWLVCFSVFSIYVCFKQCFCVTVQKKNVLHIYFNTQQHICDTKTLPRNMFLFLFVLCVTKCVFLCGQTHTCFIYFICCFQAIKTKFTAKTQTQQQNNKKIKRLKNGTKHTHSNKTNTQIKHKTT